MQLRTTRVGSAFLQFAGESFSEEIEIKEIWQRLKCSCYEKMKLRKSLTLVKFTVYTFGGFSF